MSNLILVRHAIAEDRDEAGARGIDDAMRPLTDKGRHRMQDAAQGLHRLLDELSFIATSPLLRATQTAEVLARSFDHSMVIQTEHLAPGASYEGLLGWLDEQQSTKTVACVGHQPDLGMLAGWLLTGRDQPILAFGKGGACCIEFAGKPRPGTGILRWHLPPKALRQLTRR